MLAHSAYFETLASIEDETSLEWRSTLAGLVVLRLVDSWLDLGTHVVTTDITGLRAVRETIHALSEGDPVRSILGNVVDALEQAEVATLDTILPPLLAYGQALQYASKWLLARDVFSHIRTRASDARDSTTVNYATLRLGVALRHLGDLDEADDCYRSVITDAEKQGDIATRLQAQTARAKVVMVRGDLPRAEELLGEIIATAKQHGLREIRVHALQEQAMILHLRGQYSAAIRLGYEALENTTPSATRDRILADIAASFMHLGYFSASRDANLLLVSTAEEQHTRWIALINLMSVAAQEGQEVAFEQYRHTLAQEALPPRYQAYYCFDAAKGHRRFGNTALAVQEFAQARQLAERYEINQLVFEVEQAEAEVQVYAAKAETAWPTDIVSIASVISDWRQLDTYNSATNTEGAVV